MQALSALVAGLKGYRTYLAAAAALLSAIAPLVGFVDPSTGQALSGGFTGLAIIFHRMAVSDHALTLAELQQDVTDAAASIEQIEAAVKGQPAPGPATIPITQPTT